jgi:hypothetical protein
LATGADPARNRAIRRGTAAIAPPEHAANTAVRDGTEQSLLSESATAQTPVLPDYPALTRFT